MNLSLLTKNVLLLFLFLIASFRAQALVTPVEEKPFVIVIPSQNNKEWYEKNLDSVFSQNYKNYRVVYIADAPTDNTDQLVEKYVAEKHQESRFTLLKNKERKGMLACMCQAIFACRKEEIIVDLEGCDWLAHEDALSYLNSVYADPDVWMTYGQFIYYPSFSKGFAKPIPAKTIEKNDLRNLKSCITHLRTFYAALFQQIDKEDLLIEGRFFPEAGDLAYLIPMLEMSGEHVRFIPDVLYVFNYTFHRLENNLTAEMDRMIRSKNKYSPLPELPIAAASIYLGIKDIAHPTLDDYHFVQNYLTHGKRDHLKHLAHLESVMRGIKLIGPSLEEQPVFGSVHLNCNIDDRQNCIILYSTFNRNYPKAMKRLLQHIADSDFKGHVLYRLGGWPDEEGGSLALSHVPYAFKACFFKEAQRMGFKRVLWLDSSVVPVASLNEIFAMIEEQGYFVMGNSHAIGPFMNPRSAAYFGLTLPQTYQIPSCSAGLFGADLTQPKSALLLDLWYRAAFDNDAYFSERFDQNALSMLLYQFDMMNFTDISRMPHSEIGQPIKSDSLFYLDRLFVQETPSTAQPNQTQHKENDTPIANYPQQTPLKKIYITPGYWVELFAIDNPLFNRDNCLDVMYRLREIAKMAGYELLQADNLDSLEDFEYLIVYDVFLDQLKQLEKYPLEKKVLFLWEPPSVLPENYNLDNHCSFSKVYTWNDALIDDNKYFKFFYPVMQSMIEDTLDYPNKQLCALIACNKTSDFPGELYSERSKLIEFFENNPHNTFTLFGKWWSNTLRNYAGPIHKKVDILKNFRFCFAYENIRHIPGYITEKIFDSFHAGTVPIYWGAPNIGDYIPENCYILRENFSSDEDLYSHLSTMDETRYQQYLKDIRNFLTSKKAQLYSKENFIQLFMKLITTPPKEYQ
jgi:alpha(1,3/1,4) fucosyltransferase